MHVLHELAEEHITIMGMLHEVVNLGIITPEAQSTLLAVKSLILSHLKKENDQFYPVLRQAAKTDRDLADQLQAHGRELEAVYGLAFRFFNKYAEGAGGSNKEFAQELGMIYAALRERIRREEGYLFKEYEKLISQKKT